MQQIDSTTLLGSYGLFAASVEVLQSTSGGDVLRVETDRGPVVLKHKKATEWLEVEIETHQRLSSHGLPVAPLLGHGVDPVGHVVFKWVEGVGLSTRCSVHAQQHAGAVLRQVHDLGGGRAHSKNPSWGDWMWGWLNHALPWWRDTQAATTHEVDRAWKGFEEALPLFVESAFILFDGRPEHFLIQGRRVVALLDLENARSGDAGMDLGVLGVEDEGLLPSVLEGYGAAPDENERLRALLPFYVFLRRLARAEYDIGEGKPAAAAKILQLVKMNPFPFA